MLVSKGLSKARSTFVSEALHVLSHKVAYLSHNMLVQAFHHLPWCQVDVRQVKLNNGTCRVRALSDANTQRKNCSKDRTTPAVGYTFYLIIIS